MNVLVPLIRKNSRTVIAPDLHHAEAFLVANEAGERFGLSRDDLGRGAGELLPHLQALDIQAVIVHGAHRMTLRFFGDNGMSVHMPISDEPEENLALLEKGLLQKIGYNDGFSGLCSGSCHSCAASCAPVLEGAQR